MQDRLDQIATMLEHARERGERPPALADVMDHLLAPLYMRAVRNAGERSLLLKGSSNDC
jgi:hypothetical protein